MASARSLYRATLALASLGMVATGAAVFTAVRALAPVETSAAELAAVCERLGLTSVSASALAVAGLTAVVIATAARGLQSLVRNLRAQRRLLRSLGVSQPRTHGDTEFELVHHSHPFAFCAGWARPRIYVSTGAYDRLGDRELAAVTAHEAHHRARRDPLRLLVVRVLADALFFVPALRRMASGYESLAELAADDSALAVGPRRALASALVAVGDGPLAGRTLHVAPERVDNLLGRPPTSRLPARAIVVSVLGALALAVPTTALAAGVLGPEPGSAALLAQTCMAAMTGVAAVAAAAAIAAAAMAAGRHLRVRRD